MAPYMHSSRIATCLKTWSDPLPHHGTAGAGVADARYFLRGIRECCTMVLSLAASHCGGGINPAGGPTGTIYRGCAGCARAQLPLLCVSWHA